MNRQALRELTARFHIDTSADFHALPSSDVDNILDATDVYKYRAPRNANGSRGRYFHALLCRAEKPATAVFFIVQSHGCCGWEDINTECTRADGRRSLREYRENQGGALRLITRREISE